MIKYSPGRIEVYSVLVFAELGSVSRWTVHRYHVIDRARVTYLSASGQWYHASLSSRPAPYLTPPFQASARCDALGLGPRNPWIPIASIEASEESADSI